MALNKKTKALFKLMECFLSQKEISNDDVYLLDAFGCSSKTLERYLNEIESTYDHIITIKKNRKKVWKLVSISDIFEEFIKNSEDLSQLFLMAQEFDPEIFKELERGTFSKIAKNDENVFLFKNSIMEEIQSDHAKKIFKNLKTAIKNYEYRDISFKHNISEEKNAKCLKLLFMDNNWYLALIDQNDKLKFRRLSFIENVKYAEKNSYQKSSVEKHLKLLNNGLQNSMTLLGKETKTATIKAKPKIAKYFDNGMKKFLSSQTFVKKEEDGSIIFTVEYTQELEILPFIQKWMPDLIIVEPKSLKDAYIKKLQKACENHTN